MTTKEDIAIEKEFDGFLDQMPSCAEEEKEANALFNMAAWMRQ